MYHKLKMAGEHSKWDFVWFKELFRVAWSRVVFEQFVPDSG